MTDRLAFLGMQILIAFPKISKNTRGRSELLNSIYAYKKLIFKQIKCYGFSLSQYMMGSFHFGSVLVSYRLYDFGVKGQGQTYIKYQCYGL